MYCSRCGQQQSEGATFCMACGEPLAPREARRARRPWPVWVGACLSWSLAGVMLLGMLISLFETEEESTETAAELLVQFLFFGGWLASIFLMFFRQGWSRILYVLISSIMVVGALMMLADGEVGEEEALGLLICLPVFVLTVVFSYLPISNAWYRRR